MPSSVLQRGTEGEGLRIRTPEGGGAERTSTREGKGAAPVQGVLEVRVVLEGAVTEDHRGLGTAANWEGVSYHCPLGTDRRAAVGGRDWPAPQVGVQSLEWRLPRPCPADCPPPLSSPGAPLPEPGPSPGRAGAQRGGTSLEEREGQCRLEGCRGRGRGTVLGLWGGCRAYWERARQPPASPAPVRASGEHTLVRMGLPDALGCLEGMEGVGEVHVGVRLVHQSVQHVHSLHDSHPLIGEAPKLGMLGQKGKVSVVPGPALGSLG